MSVAGSSRMSELDRALDQLVERGTGDRNVVRSVLDRLSGAPTESDIAALAGDLFAVVDVLTSSTALRRALTDPGASAANRQQLVHNLFDAKVSKAAVSLVVQAVELRWGGGLALVAGLERQAVRTELVVAEQANALDETEDELFRFARLVEGSPDLRNVLSNRSVPVDKRQDLIAELLEGRVTDSTIALAKRAVVARERTFAHTIEGYITLAAALKNRVVATVRVAQPMTSEQSSRLKAALATQVGRDVAIQEIVEPDVMGGIRVELGDEVIEGTVAGRLEQARRLFG